MTTSQRAALLALPFSACVTLGLAGAAWGQGPQCGPRSEIIDTLAEHYQERLVSRGVTSGGALLEILSGPSGGWSILVTVPGGPTCLVSSGEGWRALRPAPGEGDSPV